MTRKPCRAGAVLAAAAILLLGAACNTLPVTGEVHTRPDTAAVNGPAPYFVPPGPVAGADQEMIVRGFLIAVQANPRSTAVARSFLSERDRVSWKPDHGTIVYAASTLAPVAGRVEVRLTDAHRIDPRGRWLGGTATTSFTLSFSLVQENGQWRIVDPPRVLPVPTSYFRSLYVPFSVGFLDRSGTVLVPTRVYLPRGEQVASNLVRSLLAGPAGKAARTTRRVFPPGIGLDLAVVIDDQGVAEVPLDGSLSGLSPPDLYRAVVQLGWTLRQVAGISRIRVSFDGVAIPLLSGSTDVSVEEGREYDPTRGGSAQVIAVAGGRVVHLDGKTAKPVEGPLGAAGFAVRSVAQSLAHGRIAAVTASGRRVFLAPDKGSADPGRVRAVLDRGSNLLRPVFDRFGGLWVVDATTQGAVVHLITGTSDRVVNVPGVSGTGVTAFTISRDGTRLVAGIDSGPAVLVSNLVRGENGRLLEALPSDRVQIEGVDPGRVLDLGQDTATTVTVLTRSTSGALRVVAVELDGSPGQPDPASPDPVPAGALSLLADPDPAVSVRILTQEGRLYELAVTGEWTRTNSGIDAAALTQ